MLLIGPLSHFSSFSLHWEWSVYLLTRNIWKLISKMSIGKFQLNRTSCTRVQNLHSRNLDMETSPLIWGQVLTVSLKRSFQHCCQHWALSKRVHEKLPRRPESPCLQWSSPGHTWSCSAKIARLQTTQSGLRYGATLTNRAASGCDQLWPWGLFRFVCITNPMQKLPFICEILVPVVILRSSAFQGCLKDSSLLLPKHQWNNTGNWLTSIRPCRICVAHVTYSMQHCPRHSRLRLVHAVVFCRHKI